MTRQGWRTAELRAPQLARCVDLGEPTQPSKGKTSEIAFAGLFACPRAYSKARTQLLLSSATTTVWGHHRQRLTQWFVTTMNTPKEYAMQPWDACVSARTPHLTASSKTPVPPALASMAWRGGETACGEFPASLVLVSDLLVYVLLTFGRTTQRRTAPSSRKQTLR